MTCPKCNAEAAEGAAECPRCGVIFSNVKRRERPAQAAQSSAPVEIPPVPERKRQTAGAWAEHIRTYAEMTRDEQAAWFASLSAAQQAEFSSAWDRMGGNVPQNLRVTCPRCGAQAKRGDWPLSSIVVAIILFPIGLLALLSGRNPTICGNCGNNWRT